jgi:hypothetical protein
VALVGYFNSEDCSTLHLAKQLGWTRTGTFLLDNRTLYGIKEKCREYLLWADLPWSGTTNSEC